MKIAAIGVLARDASGDGEFFPNAELSEIGIDVNGDAYGKYARPSINISGAVMDELKLEPCTMTRVLIQIDIINS